MYKMPPQNPANPALARLGNLIPFTRKSKKDDLPTDAIGRVIEADGKSIIATVESNIELHRHSFIEVKSVGSHILIAQIENLTGKEVKVGVQTAEGSVSFMVSAKVTQTKDVEETRVLLSARIVSFIGPSDTISVHRPTTGYVGEPVFLATPDNLIKVFSRLDDPAIIPLNVGTVVGLKPQRPSDWKSLLCHGPADVLGPRADGVESNLTRSGVPGRGRESEGPQSARRRRGVATDFSVSVRSSWVAQLGW
jgi:hypothetical protein